MINVASALVILNPVSGQGDPEKLRGLVGTKLGEAGVDFEIRETQGEGDALEWARDAHSFDLVIVSGGDGTVMEAMSGIVKNKLPVPLAQLPAGTANLLARALDIPTKPEEALDVALSGVAVPVDVGYLPDFDRYFALVAGAGWDAQLIEDASRELKDRLGFLAYVMTGTKNLFKLQRSHIKLEIDGEQHVTRAHTVMVVNVGEIAGMGLKLGEGISPHDGKLNLAVAAPQTLAGLARLGYRLATNQFENYRDLKYFSASKIRITATPPLEVEIDGEAIGTTPLYVEAVPNGAVLIVPQDYAERHGLKDARQRDVTSG